MRWRLQSRQKSRCGWPKAVVERTVAFGHERTFESSGRVRFVRLHTFRNRDPGLFATGPYMHVRLQPARIVQRSGLN